MMKVAVACREIHVGRRLTAVLDVLHCPYVVVKLPAPELPAPGPGTVYCVDSRLAVELPRIPDPAVIMLSGALVSDEIMCMLQRRRVCTLRLAEVTTKSLLSALLSATTSCEVDSLSCRLRNLRMFRDVDKGLLAAFLENPSRMLRLEDMRRALAPLSREAAQARVRACGFHRAEHLFTALRLAAGSLLFEAGLSQPQVEEYLGIFDRGSFRRACRRAGVPTLARDLRPEVLSELLPTEPEPAEGHAEDASGAMFDDVPADTRGALMEA
jgi:hypothetical protein